jgi:hypothetical protein
MVTFKVTDVKINNKKLNTKSALECVTDLLTPPKIENRAQVEFLKERGKYTKYKLNKPEAMSGSNDEIVESKYGLVDTIHHAFASHYPLILDPDSVWLTLTQGLARHIEANAEELRHQFVQHKGKEKIIVHRDSFVKDDPDNDWQGTFPEFSSKIKSYIGKKHDMIVSDFSTTGVFEKAISEIVLMDAMKSYFTFECHTMCGIPHITLLGTAEDWKNIKERARCFGELGLSWWIDNLIPVLDEFVSAFQGNINKSFWQSIYKIDGGSGGPYISGWVNAFLPYLKDREKGPRINKKMTSKIEGGGFMNGITHSDLPLPLSKVPFIWNYYGKEFNMEFFGGTIGTQQNEDMSVQPKLGWAVLDVTE